MESTRTYHRHGGLSVWDGRGEPGQPSLMVTPRYTICDIVSMYIATRKSTHGSATTSQTPWHPSRPLPSPTGSTCTCVICPVASEHPSPFEIRVKLHTNLIRRCTYHTMQSRSAGPARRPYIRGLKGLFRERDGRVSRVLQRRVSQTRLEYLIRA